MVFQLFDNRFYMARTEEGGLIPAVKEATAGSKYHIHGELVFAPKELQYSVFNTVKPVLDAAASFQKIVISPLPRYLHTRCCEEGEGHISNRDDVDYKVQIQPGGGSPLLQAQSQGLLLQAGHQVCEDNVSLVSTEENRGQFVAIRSGPHE